MAKIIGEGAPAGNFFDKYSSRNPLYRLAVGRFLRDAGELARAAGSGIASVSEIGCGEGYLTAHLARLGFSPITACDVSERVIARARELNGLTGISYHMKSVYDIGSEESADLVVCCEVLEHLSDPRAALDRLHEVALKYCLLSVPREPLWRALNVLRGRYLRDLGNTPGHLRHWSSREFLGLVSERFRVLEVRRPIPWTMVLCEHRD
jgi:SAM-dependent methyltransferase